MTLVLGGLASTTSRGMPRIEMYWETPPESDRRILVRTLERVLTTAFTNTCEIHKLQRAGWKSMLRIKLFCHSIVSDWNHGNAHFLRGVLTELSVRGHDIEALEPESSWSRRNLVKDYGNEAIQAFERRYPRIKWRRYDLRLDSISELIQDADIVLVHEWNEPVVIQAVANHRRRNNGLRIFFHDTHHRAVTAETEMRLNDLSEYDAILVYGRALKEVYDRLGWGGRTQVWHEAADTRIFKPIADGREPKTIVWIGNWGDDERTQEIEKFLMNPVRTLGLRGEVYGVRYPDSALDLLKDSGLEYRGWLPNYVVPETFARHRVTVHIPRRPYIQSLPGIPTIRPFEAMACGIPLICALWQDSEGLFRRGEDYLFSSDGNQMQGLLREVMGDDQLAASLSRSGLETIRNRHTCTHRVDELLAIYESIRPLTSSAPSEKAGVVTCT
jgi:spore maturation protein CgeB